MLNLFVGFKHIINREDEEEENTKKKVFFLFYFKFNIKLQKLD